MNRGKSSGSKESSSRHASSPSWETFGDFTTTLRVLPISGLAIVIGAVCAFVALALLRLIGLFTNLFYYGRWSSAMVSPVGNHLGWLSVLVPVAGAGQYGGHSWRHHAFAVHQHHFCL